MDEDLFQLLARKFRTTRFSLKTAFAVVLWLSVLIAIFTQIDDDLHRIFPLGIWIGATWFVVARINRASLGTSTLPAVFIILASALPRGAVESRLPGAERSQCGNSLKQITLALERYREAYRRYPPSFVADQNGRPMHSWRVLILPFLGEEVLYSQYSFKEPWDGPHNRKLHDKELYVYRCLADHGRKPSTDTSYLAVVGTGSPLAPSKGQRTGKPKSDSLLVVEVADSGIHWMEPRDLHVVQMNPIVCASHGQGISSHHINGAHVSFADGTVHFLKAGTSVAEHTSNRQSAEKPKVNAQRSTIPSHP